MTDEGRTRYYWCEKCQKPVKERDETWRDDMAGHWNMENEGEFCGPVVVR